MTFAAINSDTYNLVLFLHLFSVILGTGSAFFAQVVTSKYKKSSDDPQVTLTTLGTLMAPSLLLSGVFGGALVGMSGDVYDFSQLWLTFAGIFWLTSLAAATILYKPPFLTLPDLQKYHPFLTAVLHLSLTVMLIVMVWKPGY